MLDETFKHQTKVSSSIFKHQNCLQMCLPNVAKDFSISDSMYWPVCDMSVPPARLITSESLPYPWDQNIRSHCKAHCSEHIIVILGASRLHKDCSYLSNIRRHTLKQKVVPRTPECNLCTFCVYKSKQRKAMLVDYGSFSVGSTPKGN